MAVAERLTVFHMECAWTHRRGPRSCVWVGPKPDFFQEYEPRLVSPRLASPPCHHDPKIFCLEKKEWKNEGDIQEYFITLCRCIHAWGKERLTFSALTVCSGPKVVNRISASVQIAFSRILWRICKNASVFRHVTEYLNKQYVIKAV